MTLLLNIVIIAALQQPMDATALNFTIDKNSIIVQVGRWKTKTTAASEINQFIDNHIKSIDPDKIFIYGDGQGKYSSFKNVIQALKKHDWIKFKFVDTNTKNKTPQVKPEAKQI